MFCFLASFEACLLAGLQEALWLCGRLPKNTVPTGFQQLVIDLDEKRDFFDRYETLLFHHSIIGQKTNPNSGNENGDARTTTSPT